MAESSKEFNAFDEGLVKLHEAGMSKKLFETLKKNPELLAELKRIAPKGPGPIAGDWSCCIGVNNARITRELEEINPAPRTKG
jgi:hypothetical protein